MAAPVEMSYDRSYPIAPEQAFDAVLAMPLERLFPRRYGPIPPVRKTERGQPGWDAVGHHREIRLADGGTLHEELTEVRRPHCFAYRLSEIRGPMKPLAAAVDGRWDFAAVDGGTRITWSWTMHPRVGLLRPLLPPFARIWRGFARCGFDQIAEMLGAAA
jgi:hypothetical protein